MKSPGEIGGNVGSNRGGELLRALGLRFEYLLKIGKRSFGSDSGSDGYHL